MSPSIRRLLGYLRTMLRQPSTWRGAVMLAALASAIAANPAKALELLQAPTSMETMIGLGLFVAGLIGAFVPDQVSTKEKDGAGQQEPPT